MLPELDRHLDHVLVHSGQNYDAELNADIFSDLELRPPDRVLDIRTERAATAIGDVISQFDEVLTSERPDAVLVYGDTNSCLGVIASKRRRIPVFHMEAGNRCFDARVPEEVNRRILDHISDVNMTNSEHARRYLLREGLRPETVICTGSPMKEVLDHFADRIASSTIRDDLGLDEGGYVLVSAHREENVDEPDRLSRLVASLNDLALTQQVPVIVSTHPRTRRRLESAGLQGRDLVRFLRPFGFFDYVRLQRDARCVVSDSGTLTEESSLLGFPGVMIREAHERPEGVDVGTVVFTRVAPDDVCAAVELVLSQGRAPVAGGIADYQRTDVSQVVVRTIVSYVQYLRRTVWFGAPPVYD